MLLSGVVSEAGARKTFRNQKGGEAGMKLYMAVEGDALGLPLAVCGSVEELAAALGLKRGAVASMISQGKKRKRARYIRMEVEEGGKMAVRWCGAFQCPITGHHFCCADCRRRESCPERCGNTPAKCGLVKR